MKIIGLLYDKNSIKLTSNLPTRSRTAICFDLVNEKAVQYHVTM